MIKDIAFSSLVAALALTALPSPRIGEKPLPVAAKAPSVAPLCLADVSVPADKISTHAPTALTMGSFGGGGAAVGYQAIFSATDKLAAGTCYDVLTPVIRLSHVLSRMPPAA